MTKLPALIAAIVMIPSLAWTVDDRLVAKKSPLSYGDLSGERADDLQQSRC